jgi:hypothetical protein
MESSNSAHVCLVLMRPHDLQAGLTALSFSVGLFVSAVLDPAYRHVLIGLSVVKELVLVDLKAGLNRRSTFFMFF